MLEGKANKPNLMMDEDWEKMDKKARVTIFLSMSSNILFNVTAKKTTKDLWDKLAAMYEMASGANKVFIMKKL